MRLISLLVMIATAALVSWGQAQGPQMVPPPGKLHVTFQGDASVRFSYLEAPGKWKTSSLPTQLTLQPGARYLFKLEGLPGLDGQALYPTLEVLDVLYLPRQLKASDHPAPINLTEVDAVAAFRGAMITKIITLEDPDGPYVGIGGNVNGADVEPLAGLDPYSFAKEVGRPLAILRLGNKEPSADDLAGRSPKGMTGFASCGPMVPVKPFKIGEECLRDGADMGKPAHLDGQGKLKGLDPSDTVMVYSDVTGRKHILPSNPVCLCVPRYVTLRAATPISAINQQEAAERVAIQEAGLQVARKERPRIEKQLEEGIILKVKARAAVDIGLDRVVTLSTREGTKIIGRIEGPKQVVGVETPPEDCKEGPLELCKSVSTDKAQIGDVVTFTIKYANKTCHPIHDVAIADNLTSRLEYVPGTQKSSREAIFVTQNNEVNSIILRWEIKDAIPAGQSGEVSFQARIK